MPVAQCSALLNEFNRWFVEHTEQNQDFSRDVIKSPLEEDMPERRKKCSLYVKLLFIRQILGKCPLFSGFHLYNFNSLQINSFVCFISKHTVELNY